MAMRTNGSGSFRIIAHRCRGFDEADNSLAALRKALASDVDEIEVDVQITKDGRALLGHDIAFRGTDGKNRRIHEVTLTEAERLGGESLADALALFAKHGKGKILNIDIKRFGIEPEVVKLIRKHQLEKRVLIVSWSGRVLEEIHRLAPELRLSYSFIPKLSADYRNALLFWYTVFFPKIIRKQIVPLEVINLMNLVWPVSRSIVRRLHDQGYEVVVVNADTLGTNERLRKIGVDGTMTNRPKDLLAARN